MESTGPTPAKSKSLTQRKNAQRDQNAAHYAGRPGSKRNERTQINQIYNPAKLTGTQKAHQDME